LHVHSRTAQAHSHQQLMSVSGAADAVWKNLHADH